MAYPLTITASAMHDINRSAILEIIRREPPISRTAIARKLHVSLPTIMRITEELIEEGFVRLQGETEWSGGRRRPLLEFNTEGYVVLGVDMGGTKMYGAVSDLGGNMIDEINIPQHGASGEESFALLVKLIDDLLASPKVQGRRVRGIGIGVPGIISHDKGVVKWVYSLNWKNFPLKAKLAERYDLPIIVDNDVNLAALGEHWFGAGQNTKNMVLMTIDTGIGAGIIIEGALYSGSGEAAGEIGQIIPGREFFGSNYVDYGALESVASGTGIARRARKLLTQRGALTDSDTLFCEDVFKAARMGQDWALSIIDEEVDYLSIAIASLSACFDPELVVLGGGVSNSADLLIEPILSRLNGMIPTLPRLVASSLGLRAAVMGAITKVLHLTSNYYLVRKLG